MVLTLLQLKKKNFNLSLTCLAFVITLTVKSSHRLWLLSDAVINDPIKPQYFTMIIETDFPSSVHSGNSYLNHST